MQTYEVTYTAYRDEPVEHIRTLDVGSARHYQCKSCGTKLWSNDDDEIERFVVTHKQCQ